MASPWYWFFSQQNNTTKCHEAKLLQHVIYKITSIQILAYAFARGSIDRIYSWDWVKSQVNPKSPEVEGALRNAYDHWNNEYGTKMRLGTAVYGTGAYKEVLERLADAPWLGDLVESFLGKDIFAVLDYDGPALRKYALEVAREGYGGFGACVDHAVASGLLLFQYTTFWYWIMRHVEQNNTPELCRLVTGPFNYDPQNIVTDFVDACRAVAFHNIQPSTKSGKTIIPRLTISTEPITCLAILCDELQRWDRYPAGLTHLNNYRQFSASALESDDIALMCNGTRDEPRASFVVLTWADPITGPDLLTELRNTIAARLPEYLELLDIQCQ